MSFYSDMATMADKLLRQFGVQQPAVLTRETPTGTEDAPGPPIRKNYPVIAVVTVKYLGSTEGNVVGEKSAETLMILSNKRSVVMSAMMSDGKVLPIEPTAGDKFTFGGQVWGVEASAPVAPGGITIIYKLDISR